MSGTALPPLNWLRAFEASARHLSFTGAGTELGLTQSAVSQQIKALENHLRRPLFFRRVRRLELTEAGKGYLPVVQDAFNTLARGTRSITGDAREKVLQVQANMAFSVFWLAPRLGRLFAAHPSIRINVSTALWDPERTASAADVEIRFGAAPTRDAVLARIGAGPTFPVAAPDFELPKGGLRDVNLFDCAGIGTTWDDWAEAAGLPLPRGKTVTYASTFTVGIAAATAGVGMALAHGRLLDGLIANGHLIRPFETTVPTAESYFLMEPAATRPADPARLFCDWLLSELKNPGP